MIAKELFVKEVIRLARQRGFTIGANRRSGEAEIDFGDKKLRAGKIAELWPAIVAPGADVAALLDKVSPGRECAHGPIREIVEQLRTERRL